MKLSDLGEITLLQMLKNKLPETLPHDVVGFGDDCAVIPKDKDKAYLVTTDLLVEGTHFLTDQIAPTDLGYKTMAVNISDVAAMGGQPRYAFLSMALPSNLDSEWLLEFLNGIQQACKEYGVLLLGGDTTESRAQQFFNLTLIGEVKPAFIKYRHTAKVGDVICVTGNLGDSAAALLCLQQQKTRTIVVDNLIKKHCHPRAHIEEGKCLAQLNNVHAMMDISDGLAQDLQRLIEASSCGAQINLDALPISDDLALIAPQLNQKSYNIAAMGGEDYCLLLTVDPAAYPEITARYQAHFNRPLVAVGQVVAAGEGLSFLLQGKAQSLPGMGYKHFS